MVLVLACARAALAQAGGAADVQGESPTAAPPESAAGVEGGQQDGALVSAREAFKSGAAHARAKEWREALEDFRRSAALRPHPVTTYDMGYCDKELGHAARARKELRVALAQRDVTGATLPKEFRTEALRFLDGLEHTVARVSVAVDGHGDRVLVDQSPLEIDLDGETSHVYLAGEGDTSASPPVSGRILILLDPGKHVLVATRAGLPQASLTIEVREGQSLSIQLLPAPSPTRDTPPPPAHRDQSAPDWRLISAFSAFGVGAAGLVTGTVFGVLALNKKQQIDDTGECQRIGGSTVCRPDLNGEVESLHFRSNAATAGFIVGGVGVAAGAAILLFASPRTGEASRQTGLQLWFGPRSTGVRGAF